MDKIENALALLEGQDVYFNHFPVTYAWLKCLLNLCDLKITSERLSSKTFLIAVTFECFHTTSRFLNLQHILGRHSN